MDPAGAGCRVHWKKRTELGVALAQQTRRGRSLSGGAREGQQVVPANSGLDTVPSLEEINLSVRLRASGRGWGHRTCCGLTIGALCWGQTEAGIFCQFAFTVHATLGKLLELPTYVSLCITW